MSLGSNQGDSVAFFVQALLGLEACGAARLKRTSSIYRTAPWGKTDQPDFLNMAAIVDALRPPRDLLAACLALEVEHGRVRGEKWGPRTLDIDLIDVAGFECRELALTLPHPHAHERAFVLAPLAEIAPRLELGARTVAQWLADCDASGVALDPVATVRLDRAMKEVSGRST